MTSVPGLIAQWRDKKMTGLALMRGLVAHDDWEVPMHGRHNSQQR
jgi:hypothetical protein